MADNTSQHYIGLFNDSYPPIMDGVAMTVYNYAQRLHQKGEKIVVVAPKVKGYVDSDDFEVLRFLSLPIPHRKPYRIGLPNIDCRFLKSVQYDYPFKLIHAHNPFVSGRLALSIAQKQGVPLVATFHSKFKEDFMRMVKCESIANLMIKRIISFFEQADEVWIPQASVEPTIRAYGYKGKLEVVNNGTDLHPTLPIAQTKSDAKKQLGVAAHRPIFLFVGQHIWEKNTQLIIESLALMPTRDFQMYFVGTGYAKGEMEKMVEQRGLADYVSFVGNVQDRLELQTYYAAADLFLFPSLYDNAPLVVREAAALHTPSIVVENSTTAEIIINNINGYVIQNDQQALADKIIDLLKNPVARQEVGKNAAQTIAFSWDTITDEVLDRYNRLIRRKQQTLHSL